MKNKEKKVSLDRKVQKPEEREPLRKGAAYSESRRLFTGEAVDKRCGIW